jgi:hypothetical protein
VVPRSRFGLVGLSVLRGPAGLARVGLLVVFVVVVFVARRRGEGVRVELVRRLRGVGPFGSASSAPVAGLGDGSRGWSIHRTRAS